MQGGKVGLLRPPLQEIIMGSGTIHCDVVVVYPDGPTTSAESGRGGGDHAWNHAATAATSPARQPAVTAASAESNRRGQ